MTVLYHGSLLLARHEVVWLFERLDGFRFVPLCLLVSPIFAFCGSRGLVRAAR